MDAVVLAAGQGTRMGPLTDRLPKPLLPIAGRPLVAHVLERAAPFVDRFVVVVGYEGERIRETLGSEVESVPIEFVEQPEQVGTADAVAMAAESVDGSFLVLNGDVLVEAEAIERIAGADAPALLGTRVENPSEYGVLSVTDGRLTDIVEKPDDPPSDLVNAGVYLFDTALAEAVQAVDESERGEFELTDAIQARIDAGVAVVSYDGFWLDVGYPWDLLTATEHILGDMEGRIDGTVHPSATLEGPVVVETGAEIGPGCVIEGPVMIGVDAEVGPNAYVRDNAVIGPGARVGHAVEVKHSVLFEGATAAHLSYIGDSILGADINLGAGTTVANLRHDDENVTCKVKDEPVDTGRRKFGVVLGDEVKTGINTSLNAGVVLSTGATTGPGETVLRNPR